MTKNLAISRENLLLIFLGLLGIFASAPIYFPYFLPFSFYYFYKILKQKTEWKSAFKTGFFFGFGYYLAIFHWVAFAVLNDKNFAFLLPVALIFVPSAIAIHLAATSALFCIIQKKIINNLMKIFAFVMLWIIHERMRASMLFPLPWWQISMTLGFLDEYMQSLFVIGINFLSFFTLCLYMLPSVIAEKYPKWQKIIAVFFIILLHSMLITYGHFRLKNEAKSLDLPFDIKIIQTNFTQYQKYEEVEYALDVHYEMIKKPLDENHKKPKLIILPETSIPFFINISHKLNNDYFEALGKLFSKNDYMLFGGVATDDDGHYYNTMFLFKKTKIEDFYHKVSLVPFGEYVPFVPIKMSFLPSMTKGKERKIFNIHGIKIAPLICYEVIFDKHIKKQKPDLIVNISNDAWFGDAFQPWQHLAHAKISAIRNKTPILRAVNKGISTYIDEYGRILQKIPRNQEDIMTIGN